jgi:PleD family two-component response regulator
VSVSVGWACSDLASPERLLRFADTALFDAKARGQSEVLPRLAA